MMGAARLYAAVDKLIDDPEDAVNIPLYSQRSASDYFDSLMLPISDVISTLCIIVGQTKTNFWHKVYMLCGLIATSLIASGNSPLDLTIVMISSLISSCLAPSSELVNIVALNGITIVVVCFSLAIESERVLTT